MSPYKRPEILSNRIIMRTTPGTIGLIRRKVAFQFFRCPHGGRGKYFEGCFSCPHGGRGEHFATLDNAVCDVRQRRPYLRRGPGAAGAPPGIRYSIWNVSSLFVCVHMCSTWLDRFGFVLALVEARTRSLDASSICLI